MIWKEKVIKFNEKKDLESMLEIGRKIEDSLPKIKFNNNYQFNEDIKKRNNYIYSQILKIYYKN